MEIATQNVIFPGSVGLAQAHPLTKPLAMGDGLPPDLVQLLEAQFFWGGIFFFLSEIIYLISGKAELIASLGTTLRVVTKFPKTCLFGKKALATLFKKTTKLSNANTAHLASFWVFGMFCHHTVLR